MIDKKVVITFTILAIAGLLLVGAIYMSLASAISIKQVDSSQETIEALSKQWCQKTSSSMVSRTYTLNPDGSYFSRYFEYDWGREEDGKWSVLIPDPNIAQGLLFLDQFQDVFQFSLLENGMLVMGPPNSKEFKKCGKTNTTEMSDNIEGVTAASETWLNFLGDSGQNVWQIKDEGEPANPTQISFPDITTIELQYDQNGETCIETGRYSFMSSRMFQEITNNNCGYPTLSKSRDEHEINIENDMLFFDGAGYIRK